MYTGSNDKREPTCLTKIIRYFIRRQSFSSSLVCKDRDIDWQNSALCANTPSSLVVFALWPLYSNHPETDSIDRHRTHRGLVHGCPVANQVINVNHPTTDPFLFSVNGSKTYRLLHNLLYTPIWNCKRKQITSNIFNYVRYFFSIARLI